MKKYLITSIAILAVTTSCLKENFEQEVGNAVFTASFDNTKTALQSDGKVTWVSGDKIQICWDGGLAESKASVYTATASGSGATTTFPASVDDADKYYAVYPNLEESSIYLGDGTESDLIFTIPKTQHGTFAETNVAVAVTDATKKELKFKNVCAIVKFTLSRSDIKEVRFRPLPDTYIVGRKRVKFDSNGIPVIAKQEGNVETVITPASGTTFAKGDYYIGVAPITSRGFLFKCKKSDGKELPYKTTTKMLTLVRSKITDFGTVDNEASDSKVLYNGITLPSTWPPTTYSKSSIEPMDCFYLDEGHPDVVPIDVGRQLFVDNFLIEQTTLSQKYHKATKYSKNPILTAQTSLETASGHLPGLGPKDGAVWWDPDDQVFKMWYEAAWLFKMAYATSPDGLNWTKPALTKKGENKLASLDDLQPNSCSVVLDYTAGDGYKYKMFFRPPNPSTDVTIAKGYVMKSKDGIDWIDRTETGNCGDRSTMFYNPFRKKWVFSIRSAYGMDGDYVRKRYYLEGDDCKTTAQWTDFGKSGSKIVYWCRNVKDIDTKDYRDPQLYNLNAVGYESIMLGWHQILVDENDIAQAAGRPKVTHLKFGFSRDGFNWYRPYKENIIASTKVDGDWDRGYVQSVGGVCAVMGDQIWFYYIGFAGDSSRAGTSASMHSNMATGLAFMRRDGFASMDGAGYLMTVPVTFSGKYLFVNTNSTNFKVAVYDAATGKEISGFEKSSCVAMNVNSTIKRVEWTSGKDLSELAGKAVKFRFSQDDGKFYSFWVSKTTNGESNGYVGCGGPGYTTNIDTEGINAYGKTIVLD